MDGEFDLNLATCAISLSELSFKSPKATRVRKPRACVFCFFWFCFFMRCPCLKLTCFYIRIWFISVFIFTCIFTCICLGRFYLFNLYNVFICSYIPRPQVWAWIVKLYLTTWHTTIWWYKTFSEVFFPPHSIECNYKCQILQGIQLKNKKKESILWW